MIYDLYVLSTSIRELRKTSDFALTEVYKAAGLLKLRAVFDFFFRPQACDSIKMTMFDGYNPRKPLNSPFDKENERWLNKQSLNTYVVHLDKQRITKKDEKGHEIPQPKFEQGKQAVIAAAVQLMVEAYEFVESILQSPGFAGLNYYGRKYWQGFVNNLDEIT